MVPYVPLYCLSNWEHHSVIFRLIFSHCMSISGLNFSLSLHILRLNFPLPTLASNQSEDPGRVYLHITGDVSRLHRVQGGQQGGRQQQQSHCLLYSVQGGRQQQQQQSHCLLYRAASRAAGSSSSRAGAVRPAELQKSLVQKHSVAVSVPRFRSVQASVLPSP